MPSTRKFPTCNQEICCASYARHVKAHNIKFQCLTCTSAGFNRRDFYIRHMKSHGSQPTNDSSMKGLSSESFTIKHDLLRLNAANFTVDLPQFANDEDSPHYPSLLLQDNRS